MPRPRMLAFFFSRGVLRAPMLERHLGVAAQPEIAIKKQLAPLKDGPDNVDIRSLAHSQGGTLDLRNSPCRAT
eukprot:2764697-Pyramimonas_sp.AAC.1